MAVEALYALQNGFLGAERSLLFYGEYSEARVQIPVACWLIKTTDGLVLFDTGVSPRAVPGLLRNDPLAKFTEEDLLVHRLDALGLEDFARSDAPLPRAVFLDLKMPRVDGWEVLRRIRASRRTARLPVVVVSESDRPEDIRLSYALGANSYLLKRFDVRSPGAYLAEAARYWVELNQVDSDREELPW